MDTRKKVLVVEDDVFLSDIYQSKLTRNNLDVCVANDGEEALVMAQEESPNLIILDILLPKKNGIQVLHELKQNPKTKSIPVIIASNLDPDVTKKKGLEPEAAEYFVKSNTSLAEITRICNKYLYPSS